MKGNEEDKSLDRRAIYHAVPFKQGPRPDPEEFLSARVKKNKEEEKSLSTVILPAKGSSQRGIWSGPVVKQSASGAEDHFQTKPGKTPFYLCAAAHSYPPNFNPYSMSSSLRTSSWRTCEFCSVFVDHEHWQPFEPTRVTAVDETVKYRISVTRGSHECRVTGLRWQSFCNVELEYSLGDWDLYSDLLEKKGFVSCGPLMDLRVISGQLAAVHLPHFICLDTQHRWRDFRMLCAEDTGVSLEDCLISQFHAVQFCHTFIPMAVLVSSGVPVKAHCDILIYLSSTAHQTLHVYLIPGDVKMKESVEKREKGSVKICTTWPDVSLQMKQHYTLSTSCSSQITPQKLKLRYTSKTPNFFKT
uniref:FIIND domain-containing protein n=1 Tax=Astyanax mexicanus TaxID=7994 RepID=A0A3B1K004_ASTMX